ATHGGEDEGVEVAALERIAAGEHDHTRGQLDKLIDEAESLGRGELGRIRAGYGAGAAVLTGEVAGAGHLPDRHARRACEVVGHVLLRNSFGPSTRSHAAEPMSQRPAAQPRWTKEAPLASAATRASV